MAILINLIISPTDANLIQTAIHSGLPCDHFAISSNLNLSRTPATKRTMTICDVRNIDIKKFDKDISSLNLYIDHDDDLAKRIEQYNSVLQDLLDAHDLWRVLSPCVQMLLGSTKNSVNPKHLKQRCERKMIKSSLEVEVGARDGKNRPPPFTDLSMQQQEFVPSYQSHDNSWTLYTFTFTISHE